MGMFDSVLVDCPNCGEESALEFQSKSGDCTLARYTENDAPLEVLIGVHRDISATCKKCKKFYYPKLMKRVIITGLKAVENLNGDTDEFNDLTS